MTPRHDPVPWPTGPADALALQKELRRFVVPAGSPEPIRIAGLDAAYSADGRTVFGAAAVLAYPSLRFVEGATAAVPVTFPYIPGLFAFREGPSLLAALGRLTCRPDLLMVHGHGIAHPRRCGIASHLGVVTGIPSVGVADTLLCGEAGGPDASRGSASPVTEKGEVIGCAVRTRPCVRPAYVSPGHLIDLAGAVRIVLLTTPRFRTPEPLRAAHRLAALARDSATFR
ncbi:endonuclease V [Methanofollis ethanolicus]|uniref:endonuclease V n=1 Tax=Methanofollis ethanolicus TaxID=488124 RepID=UPI00082B8AD5|nr:endonuclease V [Methanofollis ethanolicus]